MLAAPQLCSRLLQSALPGVTSQLLMGADCYILRCITVTVAYLLSAFEFVSWDINRYRLTSWAILHDRAPTGVVP